MPGVRIQIVMSPEAANRLERLLEKTDASSLAEVTRNALRLYEAVIDEVAAGNQFFLEKDGERAPVIMVT